jgi:ATP-dependent exoDNAse (exonuclease V) beta subunit
MARLVDYRKGRGSKGVHTEGEQLPIGKKDRPQRATCSKDQKAFIPNAGHEETLQRFMLCNDSVTVAIEIPIWLDEQDIAALETQHGIEITPRDGNRPRAITGHIDFLQVRNGCVHVLDYKPDARTNKPIAQLAIYALALTRRVPGLKLFDIKCAWFNEQEYCEFFPRTLFTTAASAQ